MDEETKARLMGEMPPELRMLLNRDSLTSQAESAREEVKASQRFLSRMMPTLLATHGIEALDEGMKIIKMLGSLDELIAMVAQLGEQARAESKDGMDEGAHENGDGDRNAVDPGDARSGEESA